MGFVNSHLRSQPGRWRDGNRPQMASDNVVLREFTLFLHPGSCAPEGGKKERRGENEGCSCEVTPHAEIVVSVSGRKG